MTSKHSSPKRLLWLLAILCSSIGCDQVTKYVAVENLSGMGTFSLFGDALRLQHVENPGAFLGAGQNLGEPLRFWLLTVFNGGLLAAIAGILIWKWNMPAIRFTAFAFLLAGGIGNLIDRVTQDGLVTDFINVGIGPVRTGIFNIADMAIMLGAVTLCVLSLRGRERGLSPEA